MDQDLGLPRPESQVFFDYVYTFANQLHEEDRLLQAGVEIVVTDSPIYLQCMYALRHQVEATDELWRIANRFESAHPSINFFVHRLDLAYERAGRYETLDQAVEMDKFIVTCLHEWHVPFKHVLPGELDTILRWLEKT